MNAKNFNNLMDSTFKDLSKLACEKGDEYSSNCDRLSNFKRAAKLFNCTPETSLRNFLGKHIVSVLNMLDDLEKNKHSAITTWNEKIGDIIIYMILLKALLYERYDNSSTEIKSYINSGTSCINSYINGEVPSYSEEI